VAAPAPFCVNDIMAAVLKVIYLKDISAKFHPDRILNDEALGSLEDGRPNKKKRRRRTTTRR